MCRLSVRQFVWKYWIDYWFVCGGCWIQFDWLSIVKHCCISDCTCFVVDFIFCTSLYDAAAWYWLQVLVQWYWYLEPKYWYLYLYLRHGYWYWYLNDNHNHTNHTNDNHTNQVSDNASAVTVCDDGNVLSLRTLDDEVAPDIRCMCLGPLVLLNTTQQLLSNSNILHPAGTKSGLYNARNEWLKRPKWQVTAEALSSSFWQTQKSLLQSHCLQSTVFSRTTQNMVQIQSQRKRWEKSAEKNCTDTYIHTYAYNRLAALCPGLPGWAGTRKVKPSGFYWSKRQWVAVASAGLDASLQLAPDR